MEQASQQALSPAAAVLEVGAAAAPALAAAASGGASATAWGLLLALAAAAGNNIGKGLQKAATRGLPALTLARKEVLFAYISNPVWLGGLLLDVAGGGAMLGALAAAPVSLVQPVAAFGLVLLAAFSHFVLQERLTAQQWQGAAVATLGIIGMGISGSSTTSSITTHSGTATSAAVPLPEAAEPPAAVPTPPPPAIAAAEESGPSPFRVLFWFVLLLGCLGFEIIRRQRQLAAAAARRRRLGPAAVAADGGSSGSSEAAVCGVEAGCCFGFSAAAARTGFQLSAQLGYSWLIVPLGIASSLGLTSSGLVLQTQGFKHGSALVVCTTAAAASIVAGVVMGLLALSEPLPASRSMQLLLLASWAAVALGVSSMAGPTSSSSSSSSSGRGGLLGLVRLQLAALAKAVLLLLPRGLRRRLPRTVLHWLGRGANVPGGLGLGVYLRQLINRAKGGRAGSSSGDNALSLRFYDDAAVAEVLEGLGFGASGDGFSEGRWQQQQEGTPAGDGVLRSTAALGLTDDGGPGLPVFGVSAATAPTAADEAAQAAAAPFGLQPPVVAAVGGVGVAGQLQVGVGAPGGMHGTSSPDFGGVLAPLGGRRM